MVYIYFDYKAQQTQTAGNVARSLLKQLECNQVDLSPDLEELYENSIRKGKEPSITAFTYLLKSYAQKYPVYAVFDAMDECADEYRDNMFTFFNELQKQDYRILISSRPHQSLPCQLNDVTPFEIAADRQDVERFILDRLERAGNKISALQNKCLNLADDAQGM